MVLLCQGSFPPSELKTFPVMQCAVCSSYILYTSLEYLLALDETTTVRILFTSTHTYLQVDLQLER